MQANEFSATKPLLQLRRREMSVSNSPTRVVPESPSSACCSLCSQVKQSYERHRGACLAASQGISRRQSGAVPASQDRRLRQGYASRWTQMKITLLISRRLPLIAVTHNGSPSATPSN